MKIPIKKYVDDETLSWEERYKRLEAHHKEETNWLISEIKNWENWVKGSIESNNRSFEQLNDCIKYQSEKVNKARSLLRQALPELESIASWSGAAGNWCLQDVIEKIKDELK